MKYLIRNCELADFSSLTTSRKDILIEGNRIAEVGNDLKSENAEEIEAAGLIAMPSFADCHSHMIQTCLKGMLDDYPITEWLVHMFSMAGAMDEETAYYSSLLGCMSALRNGTTVINDMSTPPIRLFDSTLKAVKDSRIRAVLGVTTTDVAENEKTPIFSIDKALEQSQEVYEKVSAVSKLRASVAPAGLPAVSKEMAVALKQFARSKGLLYHTHVGEGKAETESVAGKYQVEGEIAALKKLGILDEHTVMAHCIWLTHHELEIIRDTGAVPVYCPCTNMKISDGIAPISEMIKLGIPVTFGCDGEASSSNRDLVREACTGSYLQKVSTMDPTVLSAGEVFRMMTLNGWKALEYQDAGEIKPGNLADLILVNMHESVSTINPVAQLSNFLYAGSGACVDTVFCNGEMLLRNKQFTFIDEAKVISEAESVFHRFFCSLK